MQSAGVGPPRVAQRFSALRSSRITASGTPTEEKVPLSTQGLRRLKDKKTSSQLEKWAKGLGRHVTKADTVPAGIDEQGAHAGGVTELSGDLMQDVAFRPTPSARPGLRVDISVKCPHTQKPRPSTEPQPRGERPGALRVCWRPGGPSEELL